MYGSLFCVNVREIPLFLNMYFPQIKFKLTRQNAKLPTRGRGDDSGIDLYVVDEWYISPHETILIPTGVACQLPPSTTGQIFPRSSTSKREFLLSELWTKDIAEKSFIL